jgi:hypothetical protein
MAEKIDIDITATDKASPVVDKLANKVEGLDDTEIAIGADTSDAERDVKKLIDRVKSLSKEDAIVTLGIEAGQAQNDLNDLLVDLRAFDGSDAEAQVKIARINETRADLDQLTAEIKQLDGMTATAEVRVDTTKAVQGVDQLGKSADSSKSVMANMVGNTTQDLGELGGVAGSAGVAIGQMGEYMADAAAGGDKLGVILRNFSVVAVPILAVTVAVKGFMDHLKRVAAVKAFKKEEVENYGDALEDADTTLEAIIAKLHESEGLQFNIFGRDMDATGAFNKVGLGAAQAARLIDAGIPAIDAWATKMREAGADGDALSVTTLVLTQNVEALGKAEALKAVTDQFLADGSVAVADAQKAATEAIEKGKEAADAAAEAQRQMAADVEDASLALLDAESASDAFATALDRVNAASELDFALMALETVDSFDSMKDSLTGLKDVAVDWSKTDLSPDSVDELKGIPDELAAVTTAVAGMRGSIQTELQAAFDTGGIEAYTAKAEFFRGEVLDQFPAAFREAGASAGEAEAAAAQLADELGLMPSDIEIMIQLTREEEARNALDAFSSVIAGMPRDVQVAINTAIAEGDIEGALATLNDELINRGYDPIILPVDADIDPAEDTVQGFTDTDHRTTVTADGDMKPAEGDIKGVTDKNHKTTITAKADKATAASDLLNEETKFRKANILAQALTAVARSELNSLERTIRTPVDAYLDDYPTAGQIAARIGVVRVPVDTYLRNTVRVTGVRDGPP